MRRFGCVQSAGIIISIFLFLSLPACGGHKPPGASPFPAKITLNPATSASMQLGSTMVFSASAQNALPAACDIKFNGNAANYCLSQNQTQTFQATAYSQGVDITASVGPFTWSQANFGVVTITPIVTSSANVATNQATVVSNTPGQTQVVASASGVSSQPYIAETCPVQCITLQLGSNIGQTSFLTNKGASETITATAVDLQGCIVPRAPLTWTDRKSV